MLKSRSTIGLLNSHFTLFVCCLLSYPEQGQIINGYSIRRLLQLVYECSIKNCGMWLKTVCGLHPCVLLMNRPCVLLIDTRNQALWIHYHTYCLSGISGGGCLWVNQSAVQRILFGFSRMLQPYKPNSSIVWGHINLHPPHQCALGPVRL